MPPQLRGGAEKLIKPSEGRTLQSVISYGNKLLRFCFFLLLVCFPYESCHFRFLIVFPWNQRYFAAFGNLSTAAAVMGGLEKAVKNLDDIKNTYKSLSVMHSEKLHVDPDNFRVYWPFRLHPDVQEAWHKFLSVVVSALGSTTEMA
uniref:Globin domain-containing protein n=1 Tax=Monopterus albus TaxID=43700 RepID=A0A3Q3R9B3_MONAL